MTTLGKNQKKILKLLSKYRTFKNIKEINKLNNYNIKKDSLTSSLRGLYAKGLLHNIDKSKSYGYSFVGTWLPIGTEVDVPIGSIIIEGRPQGSVAHGYTIYVAKRVPRSGKLKTIGRAEKEDFLTFRDKVYKELKK